MKKVLFSTVAIAMLVSACGGKDATKPDISQPPEAKVNQGGASSSGANVGQNNNASALSGGANAAGGSGTAAGMMDPFEDPSSQLSQRIIYFDYNSAQVNDISLVNAHARYLMESGTASIRLEGHADERGSREFNVALSENRAQEVKRLMMFQGVRSDQIKIIAYGEERPMAFGHGENSWRENRRVEIVYESK